MTKELANYKKFILRKSRKKLQKCLTYLCYFLETIDTQLTSIFQITELQQNFSRQ